MTKPATFLDNYPIIALIGMMGAGKTTVGRIFSKKINREFIDLDHYIADRCGVQIPTIFDIEGEAGFRHRETLALKEMLHKQNLVLATGGGAILAQENRQLLRDKALVLYLKADANELYRRIGNDKNRPLLCSNNPKQRLMDLLAQRNPLYEATAHHTIESNGGSIYHLVKQIQTVLTQEEII